MGVKENSENQKFGGRGTSPVLGGIEHADPSYALLVRRTVSSDAEIDRLIKEP